MSWRHYLTDARTGLIIRPIDIPSFSWDMLVSDFGFTTTSKNTGDETSSNLVVPFTVFDQHDDAGNLVHEATPSELHSLLDSSRRALTSTWVTDEDVDSFGTPILWGKLGEREDHAADTTFPLVSPMGLLANRFVVRDGKFVDGKTVDTVSFENLSFRGLSAELISLATEQKNGGTLPFDLNYRSEKGNHQRTNYQAWNVQNLACATLLKNITNSSGGPDMTFRPYKADSQHVRVNFLAGSDADIYLDQDHDPIVLNWTPQGGSMEDLTVSYASPIQRYYGTGSGTDAQVITALAEDLSGVTSKTDPPVLMEAVHSDTDASLDVLKKQIKALLDVNVHELMQFTCTINVDDVNQQGRLLHPLGRFWPGEVFWLDITGYRTLPSDRYVTRLMEMSGDESSKVTLKFDVMYSPF